MTDIVERLKSYSHPNSWAHCLPELSAAADEIEKLRAALHWTVQNCLDPACVKRAMAILEPIRGKV